MATVGLERVYVAIMDPETHKAKTKANGGLTDSGILEITSEMWGTKTANLTNLEGSIERIDGNNMVVHSATNPSAPQISFNFNDLPFEYSQAILGYVENAEGAYELQEVKPDIAVLVQSAEPKKNKAVFFAGNSGVMQETSKNMGTNTNTAKTRADDNFVWAANGNDIFKKGIKKFFEGSKNFDRDKVFNHTFGVTTGDPAKKAGGAPQGGGVTPGPAQPGAGENAHQ